MTDFLGYTGTMFVLILKEFCHPDIDWAVFYNQFAGYVGIFCCILFVCSFVYLRQRYQKENAVPAREEAFVEADSQGVLTMA